jgi:hypothetical protein
MAAYDPGVHQVVVSDLGRFEAAVDASRRRP